MDHVGSEVLPRKGVSGPTPSTTEAYLIIHQLVCEVHLDHGLGLLSITPKRKSDCRAPHCQQARVSFLMARYHYKNVAKVKEKYILTQGR